MNQEIIRLGSACNQKCLFCNQEENIPKKNKKQILYELLNFRKRNIEKLVISGGEPTLFKEELFFTISTAKKLGFKEIELQSNAVLLENINYVKKLIDLGLNSAFISLHYLNSEISDELTQAKGTFEKTLIGIKNLINSGIDTTLNIVINRLNYKNILDYVVFINKNIKGFNGLSLSIVVPGKDTIKNNLLPKYREISKYLIMAYDYCIKNNINFQNPGCGIPVCYIRGYEKYSLEYQNYKTGKMYNKADLEKNSRNKVKSEKCKKCIYDKYCLGLWKGYVDLYGFDYLVPII